MSKLEKLLIEILQGTSNTNIRFDELRSLLIKLGFTERIKGSHHIFVKKDIVEIINIQPQSDGKSKPYQVKQIREIIVRYQLAKK